MDPTTQLPNINFSNGMGPAILGILAFVIPLAIRTYFKDRAERKEKAAALHLQLCRMAYNAVQNAIKKGTPVEDKQEAGIEQLKKFYRLRLARDPSFEEQESARLVFDAIHGELCPGGTGTPPSATGTPGAP